MAVCHLLALISLLLPLEILADTPQNETPMFIIQLFQEASTLLASFGWYILFAILIVCLAWYKFQPQFYQWRQRSEEDAYNKKIDPEKARAQLEAMDGRYRRLQEEHDAQSRRFLEEQKKKEEQKRLEKIQDWDNHQEGKGYRNKYHPKEENSSQLENSGVKKKRPLLSTPDYNPLSGTSSGSSYRPPARCNTGG